MARILVVDDEEDICKTLQDILIEEGYEVETADSGKEAIEKVQAKKPDLVLLDVRLTGGMNGVEVLRVIRQTDKDIPVAMITAYEDIDLAQEALQLGAYDYIKKPFDIGYLRASILSKIFPAEQKNNEKT